MAPPTPSDARRGVPRLDWLLAEPAVVALISLYGREPVKVQARQVLAALRQRLAAPAAAGQAPADAEQALAAEIARLPLLLAGRLDGVLGRPLRRVLNASGILLHTNLGRAPLPPVVAAALPGLLDAYCDLEIDLVTGRRGERNARLERLLTAATGAAAALAVNNNAASLLLCLAALAAGRQVVVSRGELVEIGGSFRIPDILTAAGARLVEVGTTNRTRLADYEAAVGPDTALLLKVFPSNFRLSGFVAAVAAADLAGLGRRLGVPLLVDEGSGLLRRRPEPQLADHPSMAELVEQGCDLVCGSADKLLGGPQAGLLMGRRDLLERCRRHPLYRVLRPDRTAVAALEGVLRLHLAAVPLPLDGLWPDPARHRERLQRAAADLTARLAAGSAAARREEPRAELQGDLVQIVAADAFVGGGSAPEAPIHGQALALPGGDRLLARLRLGDPPVVGYLRQGRLLLDLRTVAPEDDAALAAAVAAGWLDVAAGDPAAPGG